MTPRAQYLIQILDKIGGPLMQAVGDARADSAASGVPEQEEAQTIAGLLGKVVEVSIAMNSALDLSPQDAQDDSLRVALAALAGPIVAGQYKQHKRIPSDQDLKRVQTSLQAVLTFGDNFTPGPEHAARLAKMAADGAPVDTHQIGIQYVHAFIPVVNAIGAFPFGQPEQKLIMDVSDRLVNRAVEMRETLMPELGEDDQKLAELAILRALVSVYEACHLAETNKLSGGGDAAPSIEPVWKAFDTRAAMLEALVKNILPASDVSAPAAVAAPVTAAPVQPAAPPPQIAAETPTPTQAAAPQIFQAAPQPEQQAPPAPVTPEQPVTPPPAQAAPAQPQTETASGGPMGFFAKPQEDSAAQPPAAPVEQQPVAPVAPEAQAAPQTPPPTAAAPPQIFQAQPRQPEQPAAPPQPPADPPPAPPSQTEEDQGDSGHQGGGGSPMSFFTKGDG
ncbi:MAG: hypothetical protein ACPGRX_03365 [Bdellovibrionales bacterium]